MSNETQLQKAIAIAIKDNYVKSHGYDGWYEHKYHNNARADDLLKFYTTDLNYLMPIAVKVQKEGTIYCQQFHYDTPEYHYFSAIVNNITIEYNNLEQDENKLYSKLFDALYEAIKLLGDEQ